MRLRVRHLIRNRYAAPVALGPHVLRMTPRGAPEGACTLRITPEPDLRHDETDVHGNSVSRLGFSGATSSLVIEARFELETGDIRPPGAEAGDPGRYLALGDEEPGVARTAERLRALAGNDPAAFAESLAATLNGIVSHDRGETGPLRSPGETLARGRGTARDMAALFVELSRRAGLPARFVTGYWAAGAGAGADRGARTWVEVLLPGVGWQGVDPTLGGRTGATHITVAAAPDLAGTQPFVGSTFGGPIPVTAEFDLNVLVAS